MDKVKFTAMKDGTKEDYELLRDLEGPYLAMTADRILAELRRHGETTLEGYKVTRLEHGLQSAVGHFDHNLIEGQQERKARQRHRAKQINLGFLFHAPDKMRGGPHCQAPGSSFCPKYSRRRLHRSPNGPDFRS